MMAVTPPIRRPLGGVLTMNTILRHVFSLLRPAVWLANWVNGTENPRAAPGRAVGLHPQDYRQVQNPMVR